MGDSCLSLQALAELPNEEEVEVELVEEVVSAEVVVVVEHPVDVVDSAVAEVAIAEEADSVVEEEVVDLEVEDEVDSVVPDKDLFIQKKFVTFFMTFQYKLKKKSYW